MENTKPFRDMVAHWLKRTSDSTASTTSQRSSLQQTHISDSSQPPQYQSKSSTSQSWDQDQDQKTRISTRKTSNASLAQHDHKLDKIIESHGANGALQIDASTTANSEKSALLDALRKATAVTDETRAPTWKEFKESQPPASGAAAKHSLIMDYISLSADRLKDSKKRAGGDGSVR